MPIRRTCLLGALGVTLAATSGPSTAAPTSVSAGPDPYPGPDPGLGPGPGPGPDHWVTAMTTLNPWIVSDSSRSLRRT